MSPKRKGLIDPFGGKKRRKKRNQRKWDERKKRAEEAPRGRTVITKDSPRHS
jgi:hypothetical protein